MSEPTRPGGKVPPRPAVARAGGGRGVRRVGAPPARQERSRTGVIFSILALIVIASLIFGTVAFGLEFPLGGEDEADQQPPVGASLVPTYEARLRDNPNDVNTMVVLANVLQNNGDYPGAIGWYEKAVALKPTDVELRLAFGQALSSYGQLFDAEIQYKKAIETDPRSAKAEYYLGLLYQRSNPPRVEEARIHFARASEIEPEGSWGRTARGALERLNATPVPATATP